MSTDLATVHPEDDISRAEVEDFLYREAALLDEWKLEEWLGLLRKLGIPAAPLRTPDELFDNAHLNAIGFFETVDSPFGPVRFPGVPTWFSRTPGHVAGPAPELGVGAGTGLALPTFTASHARTFARAASKRRS